MKQKPTQDKSVQLANQLTNYRPNRGVHNGEIRIVRYIVRCFSFPQTGSEIVEQKVNGQ